ncbi:methyltransferase [Bradyrhizobium sp. RT10b]|uniref:methyltransferase n=1 Tax=Bradyrhizobium sp. RT10b TaxID=3156331 RepID=UPI003391EE36
MSGPASVHDLVQSHRITAVIYAAAKLNLAEAIGDEAKSVTELARLVSADESALRRLLVGLTTLGLCRQADRDRFAMTELGRQLDETADPSFKDWVLFEGEMLAQSWLGLVESVRSGKSAGELRGDGDDRYAATSNAPEFTRRFNAAMVSLTRSIVPRIVAAHDFATARVVMDLGGGTGELIGGVLQRNPHLEGIAFDLARCEAGARAHFARLGIANRCRFVAGSFFEKVLGGADTILMKSILHNWRDDRCEVILRNCRDALPASGTLIVIERIMPEPATTETQDRSCAMSDLNMLRGPGGASGRKPSTAGLASSPASPSSAPAVSARSAWSNSERSGTDCRPLGRQSSLIPSGLGAGSISSPGRRRRSCDRRWHPLGRGNPAIPNLPRARRRRGAGGDRPGPSTAWWSFPFRAATGGKVAPKLCPSSIRS